MTREEIAKHLSNMLRRKSLSDKDKEAIKYAKKYIASCHVGVWKEMKLKEAKEEEKS